MSKLLIEDGAAVPDATVGGTPLAPANTPWPVCSTCRAHMQFLSQLPMREVREDLIHLEDKVLLLFQCQSQPGLCDEWDPESGGNAALLVSSLARVPLEIPQGATLLPAESRIGFVPYDDSACEETPDDSYCAEVDAADSKIIGKAGGVPLWIQGDETPHCSCGEPMVFVAQLEASGGGGINFGDAGAGYAFVCASCHSSAKFLWQCT